jgi:ATP-dependent DNA helicase RecG
MAFPLFHERGPATHPAALSQTEFATTFPGEGDYVEFKQGFPETKVREAVTAFSNSDGGVILLGVRDDGSIQGRPLDGESDAKVHRAVLGVRDPGRYSLHHLLVDGRPVVALAVGRRREGFAQMQDGRVLVRRGAMNTPLFGNELTSFLSRRALTRFESTPVGVTLREGNHRLIDRLASVHRWSPDDLPSRLHEAGLTASAESDAQLTVAGALYLLPRPADVLGKAYVEVYRYRDNADVYDRRLVLDGPLDTQVADTVRELWAEIGSDLVIIGLRRHELPRIPEAVLREAIANAVAHRVYELPNQPVRVEIRADRLVVRSPGGLPEPVTLANIREQNAARNLDVIKILRRLRLAEDAGMGVDIMQDTMDAALLDQPTFSTDGTFVEVVLPTTSTVTPQERAWVAEVEQRGDIRPEERVLLLHAARGATLTNAGARELVGLDSVHARAALQRLRALGYLAQQGTRGGATYTLARELTPPAGMQLSAEEIGAVILDMARGGRVTNESVRARTGLERAAVLHLLNRLVEARELDRHGERRGTYYTLRGDGD